MVNVFHGMGLYVFLLIFIGAILPVFSIIFGLVSIYKWNSRVLRWICPLFNIPISLYLYFFSSITDNHSDAIEMLCCLCLFFGLSIFFSILFEFIAWLRQKAQKSNIR